MEIVIQGQLAALNEHDGANRANRFAGAKLKKEMTNLVAMQVARMKPIEQPVFFTFHWFISTRHDPDNIRFATKYLLDGLVKAGKLPNDNQKWVLGFHGDYFVRVPKGKEKIVIEIE